MNAHEYTYIHCEYHDTIHYEYLVFTVHEIFAVCKMNLPLVLYFYNFGLRRILLQVTDSMLTNATYVYPENTPTTKEAYYYRTIFEKFFPKVG